MLTARNISNMFVLCLVDPGGPLDTIALRKSNARVILTCAEYAVFDMRSDTERARIPSDVYEQKYYNDVMHDLGIIIEQLISAGERDKLLRLSRVMAPNIYSSKIRNYLEATATGTKGNKYGHGGKYKPIKI